MVAMVRNPGLYTKYTTLVRGSVGIMMVAMVRNPGLYTKYTTLVRGSVGIMMVVVLISCATFCCGLALS